MRELTTSVEIDATPARVWEILTDFASYPEWNPFITSASGRPERGADLEIRMQPPGGRGMTFRPRVLEAEPERELRWLGRLFLPGIFDGEHSLRIEPIEDERVRFVQSERFRGVLVPMLGSTLEKTRRGFEAMNEALKRRAEGDR
jgi:hypothetical protein